MRRPIQLARDESGFSYVFLGVGLLAFLMTSALAIDVGMFMTARAQAQNSADAGALAGAVALVFDDYTDHSTTGPAVQNAVVAAKANTVIHEAVSVNPADVVFLNDERGQPNRVNVTVYRTATRGNPLTTMIGGMLGVKNADVRATATAEASPANAMTCVKPFMIPDKWIENQTAPWDPNDTFDQYNNKGKLLTDPDVYIPADKPGYTGYTPDNDKGKTLVLRAGTGDQINPSFYFSWKMPSDVGGDFYRENIANCNQAKIVWNTTVIQEPGDKTGPTVQGIGDLIAKDPNATWDGTCLCVKNSAFSPSPRVFPIPLYDPAYYAEGKANGRPADFRIANFLGFFADHLEGNRIYGIITTVTGLVDPNAGPAPEGAFPKAIRLVE